MKPYAPTTNKGRHLAGHDVCHRTADQPKSVANKSAKKLRHAARQQASKQVGLDGRECECWACNGTKLVTTSSNGSGLIEEACSACAQAGEATKS